MSHFYYILNGHEPVPVSPKVFAPWFHKHIADRHVAEDFVGDPRTAQVVRISTVFLGLNHNFGSEGPPTLFETMVFGGKVDGAQVRYSTWNEAEAGHRIMVEQVRKHEGVKA